MTVPATIIDGGNASSTYLSQVTGGTASGSPALLPFQLSFNGLVFGALCDVQIQKITGLRGLPAIRSSDLPRPRAHGSFAGFLFMGERIITADLSVSVTMVDPFETVLTQVGDAFAPVSDPNGLAPLQFLLPGWANPRQVMCRPTKGGLPVDVNYQFHRALIPVELTCPDPRIYDTAGQAVTIGLPSPTAGLTFPTGFPAVFGASSGGSGQIVNAGNVDSAPVFTIRGPVTWPQISFGALTLGFGLALSATDTLVVDCAARTVVLNGTASRYNTLLSGSAFFTIPPGTATIGFTSTDSTTVTGTVTAALSSAWGWV